MKGSWKVKKIISGGQSGVDRAALDVALNRGITASGYCPLGRLAEDGVISPAYPLIETPSSEYAQRTEWNVRESNATLVLSTAPPTGGTLLTIQCAQSLERPFLLVSPRIEEIKRVRSWLDQHQPATLNIAGPRESLDPGIYSETLLFLDTLFGAE
jgi:predicted Rossmann fold nucleotide-binding protein DprA/Smf involved in DNA uptake